MIWLIVIGDILVTGFMIALAAVLMVAYPDQEFKHTANLPLKDD